MSEILIGMGFAPSHVDLAVQCHGDDIDACVQFILSMQSTANSVSDSFNPVESNSMDSLRSSYDSVLLCVSDEELPCLTELETVKKDCAEDIELNDRYKRCFSGDLSQIDIVEEINDPNSNVINSNSGNSNALNGSLEKEDHFMDYLWTFAFRYDFWNKQFIRIPFFLHQK